MAEQMAKVERDISEYTAFGKLLDELCRKHSMSFRRLAENSGMSVNSAMTIVRACKGLSIPKRASILAWCRVLDATPEQQAKLLHYHHYSTPEEEESRTSEQASKEHSLE
jgi:transcriptional regulator with XRE-family HTH domain